MADSFLPLYTGTTAVLGQMDAETLTVGGQTVLRARAQVSGALDTEIARVMATTPAGTEMGLVTRLSGPLPAGTADLGNVSVTTLIPGTAATNLGKAVGTLGGATDTGVTLLALRTDTLATLTPTDGQYVRVAVDSQGALWVTNVQMLRVVGSVAHDSPDTQPPVKIGGYASAALRTAVTEADRVDASFDLQGQLRVTGALTGGVAHDSADTGNSTKIGGFASAALRTAVTESDRVDASFDLQGQLRALTNGTVAHDVVDTGNPHKMGFRAVGHGSLQTAVAASDRSDWISNRHGVPWVIGGHPNVITIEAAYTAAQTDTTLVTGSANFRIVVTRVAVLCANSNTVDVAVRVGFGAASTPTTTGVVLTHPGLAPGSGVVSGEGSGILGVGAVSDALLVTCGVPTTGSARVLVSYYTVES